MSLFDLDELDRMISDVQVSRNDQTDKSHSEKAVRPDAFDNIGYRSSKKSTSLQNSPLYTNSSQSQKSKSVKCFPFVYLSNTDEDGLSKSNTIRSCNSLRCTSCDFNVVSYKNYAWTEATDYLFLRNNYPDDDKLMTNLYKNYNSRSYCCQCRSITINTRTKMNTTDLTWVCARHTT